MTLLSLIALIDQFGLSLAVGSSTFALIFFFKAIKDGTIDDTERSFMHVVYKVLRIGMVLIIISSIANVVFLYQHGLLSILSSAEYLRFVLLFVIITNAALMSAHKMPMWLGPALAGGSWYMLAISEALKELPLSLTSWIGWYCMFLALTLVVLELIKRFYLHAPQKA